MVKSPDPKRGCSLSELLTTRPVNREAVEAHKARMLAEVLAHRERHDSGNRIDLDEAITAFEFDRAELEAELDAELSAEDDRA